MLQNITFPNFSELCHVFATQQTMLAFFLCQEYHTSLHEFEVQISKTETLIYLHVN